MLVLERKVEVPSKSLSPGESESSGSYKRSAPDVVDLASIEKSIRNNVVH